jgi:hypothetical protein
MPGALSGMAQQVQEVRHGREQMTADAAGEYGPHLAPELL